jgi:6-phosphofructokinase 1
VDFLLSGGTNATITLQQNQIVPMRFETMMNPKTGRTEVRLVNINSFTYRSARKFMIRLTPQHADDGIFLARMAAHTNLSTEGFKARYGYLMGIAPRPFGDQPGSQPSQA